MKSRRVHNTRVPRWLVLCFCLFGFSGPLTARETAFNGRWIITPEGDPGGRVFFLDLSGAGTDRVEGGFIGGPGGQFDRVKEAKITDGELQFVVERHTGRGKSRRLVRTSCVAHLDRGVLRGKTSYLKREIQWVGKREPKITERDDGHWKRGEPVALIDGGDLSHWNLQGSGDRKWTVEEGILKNGKGNVGLLVSREKFWNFDLQAEFRLENKSNGGLGLRGRYEVQILGDHGQSPHKSSNGALYGRIVPTVNASKPAGQWQTFDIRLIGREISVRLNGTEIIDRKIIEGYTAMATDPREGKPGPITLQGNHGPVEFRKIVVTPLVR